MIDLKNKTILVTRPKPQGELLCEKIRAVNGNAIYFPTIEIKPPRDPDQLKQQIAALNQYDWLIFISPQAVYQSSAILQAAWPVFPKDLQVAAVGLGSANALQAAHLPVTTYPERWSSEGLLDLPLLQEVTGQSIAIVSGEGGRDVLEKAFISRGARVERLIAYQRSLPSYPKISDYIDLFRAQKIDIMVATSGEGLHNLITLIGEVTLLHSLPLVVVSERLIGVAEELHFKQVILAENASDSAIIEALGRGINYGR